MLGILASIIDGLLVGLVYGLAAMGLTLIWGVMDVINLTHGTMIVGGMMALYLISGTLGISPYFTLPPILIGGFFVGFALYWIAVHRMMGRPPLMSLLSTFSVNLVLVGLGTAVWHRRERAVAHLRLRHLALARSVLRAFDHRHCRGRASLRREFQTLGRFVRHLYFAGSLRASRRAGTGAVGYLLFVRRGDGGFALPELRHQDLEVRLR